MTARRNRPVAETTVLDLVMKGDYEGLAKLTGFTIEQIERTFEGMDDDYDALTDAEDEEDRFFGEVDDDEAGNACA
jgi:hypothetical protein